MIGGQRCSFYSDDSDAYIAALEERANEVMRRTARFSGISARTNAILSVLYLTDALLRTEQDRTETQAPRKASNPGKNKALDKASDSAFDKEQISVWDLLDADGTGKRS